jgi:hypothetical protein
MILQIGTLVNRSSRGRDRLGSCWASGSRAFEWHRLVVTPEVAARLVAAPIAI